MYLFLKKKINCLEMGDLNKTKTSERTITLGKILPIREE